MFDLSAIQGALTKTGSTFQIPGAAGAAGAAAATPPASAPAVPPPPPSPLQTVAEAAAPLAGVPKKEGSGLQNLLGKVGKVAGLVASFYTGGAAGLAMNVGGQALSGGLGKK